MDWQLQMRLGYVLLIYSAVLVGGLRGIGSQTVRR